MLQKIKPLFTLFLLLCPLLVPSQTKSKHASFEAYIKKQVNEQVYLHTDRDVYAPGDTIWFKAYVRNKLSLKKSELSHILHVFLVSKDSVIYQWEKCLIQDSQSRGFIAIDDAQSEDTCHIVAFSSWMQNFKPDCFFNKKILIRKDFSKSQKYLPFFDKRGYFSGDTVKVSFDYLKNVNPEDRDKDIDVLFKVGTKNDLRIKSSKMEASKPISWVIPDSKTKEYQLKISNYDDFDKTVDIPYRSKIAIDFYPEGGTFIAGLLNKIGFKATYDNGQAATISGEIVNSKGEILAQTKTEHEGMGRFMIMPVKGDSYFFKINSPEQCKAEIEIPDASDFGWVLNARVSNKRIVAEIRHSFNGADTAYLALSIHGVFYAFKKIPVLSRAITSIPLTNLPGGIGVLTLMDKTHSPLAERLVFVNYDRFLMADVLPGKAKTGKLDSMSIKIKINGTNDAMANGQFSLSVYDDELGSAKGVDAPNIIASTYFNNELKGYINDPNYYFNSTEKKVQSHLDLLLMVQGWRKYHYINQLYGDTSSFIPVTQDLVEGHLQKLKFGRGFVDIPGEINVYFAGNSTEIQIENDGTFSFYPEYTKNSRSSISITGYDKNGKSNVNVTTNANRFRSDLRAYLQQNPLNNDNSPPTVSTFKDVSDQFTINLDQNIWIKELNVVGRKEPIDIDKSLAESMLNQREAEYETLMESPSIEDLIMNMGFVCESTDPETLSVFYRGGYTPVVFELDGIRYTDYSMVSYLNPADFEYFYLVRGIDAQLVYGREVAVVIKMKENVVREPISGKNPVNISRPQLYKSFYHPRYNAEDKNNPSILDLRKTIYWNPNIKVDENGEARVSFYNAQRITKIKCVLQGMTEDGNPVYGEAYYEVVRDAEIDF